VTADNSAQVSAQVNEKHSMSREAAAECSPGRKPGVNGLIKDSRAPKGRQIQNPFCRPRCRLVGLFYRVIPGLTPGATLCRRAAAC